MTRETGRRAAADELLEAVAAGDERSWETVMERFHGAVHGTLASFRFDEATRADVAQSVWVKLWENAETIRDARCLGSWLRTTTQRTAIEVVRQRKRTVLVDDYRGFDHGYVDEPELNRSDSERVALCAGFRALSVEAQELLSLVFAEQPLPYAEIARRLDRPVGALGPTRARALEQLRLNYEAALEAGRRGERPNPAAA